MLSKRGSRVFASILSWYDGDVTHTRALISRFLVVCFLGLTGGVVAFFAYKLLSEQQNQNFVAQFDSASTQVLDVIVDRYASAFKVAQQLGDIHSVSLPEASMWPNISSAHYQKFDSNLRGITGVFRTLLVPVVTPKQLSSFEAHARQLFASDSQYPVGAGYSSGEFGTYSLVNGRPVRDTSGVSSFSEYTYLTPVMLLSETTPIYGQALLLNAHTIREDTALAKDAMYQCAHASNDTCQIMTNIAQLDRVGINQFIENPSSGVVHAIRPANQPHVLVGFQIAFISWGAMLSDVLPDVVCGIVAVITTTTTSNMKQSFTYQLCDGKAELMCSLDCHDKQYDDFRRRTFLTEKNAFTRTFYEIELYPTEDYYDDFHDKLPMIACSVSASLIVFTALIFFAYDYFVSKEASENAQVLEAKRRFVRFVSHEIRTPLSTVTLGMDLLSTMLAEFELSTSREKKEQMLEIAADIEESAEVALDVLNDLLNYDKVEAGVFKLERQHLPIWELIRNTVGVFKVQAARKQIPLTIIENEKIIYSTVPNAMLESAARRQPSCFLTSGQTMRQSDNIMTSIRVKNRGRDLERGMTRQFTSGAKNYTLSLLCVYADELRLAQVFRNLVSNALKFSKSGQEVIIESKFVPCETMSDSKSRGKVFDVNIVVPSQEKSSFVTKKSEPICKEGKIVFTVRDHGPGISAENKRLLFGEGVQFNARELQAGQGSGIGLHLTKSVVELHGGRIWMESEGEGCGSTFFLELACYQHPNPIEISTPSQLFNDQENNMLVISENALNTDKAKVYPYCSYEDSPRECAKVDEAKMSSTAKTVLIVDDTPLCRKLLNKKLATNDYVCSEVESGQQCVDLIREGQCFDFIMMDYQMPGISGPETCFVLRKMGYQLPIIGVTGNVLQSDKKFFLAKGANFIMEKPFRLEVFEEYLNGMD